LLCGRTLDIVTRTGRGEQGHKEDERERGRNIEGEITRRRR
jgi:hypothetical protein